VNACRNQILVVKRAKPIFRECVMNFKSSSSRLAWALTATFMLGTVALTSAQESKLTTQNLPPAVLAAFQKAYPKAVIKGASKEKEGDKIYYEIESVDGKAKRDILYSADGNVQEIEELIATNDLPDAVTKNLKQDYPEGKILRAEKLTEGPAVKYEVIVESGKAKSEIVLDAGGKVLKTEKIGKKEKDEAGENEKENGKEDKH
jgi:Putative beta-lactamase-inhibitor-like, PepSY-like